MDFNILCFAFFCMLFIGFLLLEGFDFGAGMLLPFLGQTDEERQAIMLTMAPVWEGNEVWMIAAGAFLLASFPGTYATLFSGLYLPLLLILSSLILRGVAFEFRDKEKHKLWRNFWDWSLFSGSLVAAFLWGVAITDLLKGLPINAGKQYVGGIGDLLSLYSMTGGMLFVLLFLIHGASYLTLKLEPYLVDKVWSIMLKLFNFTLGTAVIFCAFSILQTDMKMKPVAMLLLITSVLTMFSVVLHLQHRRFARIFFTTSASILLLNAAIFAGLFPRMIVSSLDASWSLGIYNTASNFLTLKLVSLIMVFVFPVLIAFEGWKYYLFRNRVGTVELILGIYSKQTLIQMNHEFKELIKQAYCVSDAMNAIMHAFRSKNGSVINRLKHKQKLLLLRKPLRKKNNRWPNKRT